jgi:hypothetical protein
MDEERLVFRFPLPRVPREEEIVQPVAVQVALLYKILQELRRATENLNKLIEDLRSRGEVLQVKLEVSSKWVKQEPGFGLWKGVNIYNAGEGVCEVKLRRMDAVPIVVGPGESRSYMFLTPCIDAVYIRCEKPSHVELEFLR